MDGPRNEYPKGIHRIWGYAYIYIYVEPGEMAPMNLSSGQQWRHRQTKGTDSWAQWGKERVGEIERGAWKHTLPYVNRQPGGICCLTWGAQPGAP